jgi:hypothetical protein
VKVKETRETPRKTAFGEWPAFVWNDTTPEKFGKCFGGQRSFSTTRNGLTIYIRKALTEDSLIADKIFRQVIPLIDKVEVGLTQRMIRIKFKRQMWRAQLIFKGSRVDIRKMEKGVAN